MSESHCQAPLPLDMLIAYERGELAPEREQEVEAHYFACQDCSARLGAVTHLAEGICALVQAGAVSASVTEAWLQHGMRAGLRIRNYRVPPGGQVACTVAPTDDFVAIHLDLPVTVAESVDVEVVWKALDTGTLEHRSISDLSFDRGEQQLVLLFAGDQVREFPRSQWRMHAVVGDGQSQQRFGPYTLNHTPWEQLNPRPRK